MGQGTIISGTKSGSGNSSLMSLMNMYKSMSGSSSPAAQSTDSVPQGYDPASPTQSTMPQITSPELGDSAMSRRADANANHPDVLIAQGLKHADNPDVPLDYDTRMAVIEPMLRAQHFGYGGGLDTGSQSKGQGQITSGKAPDSGGLGKIASVVGMLA